MGDNESIKAGERLSYWNQRQDECYLIILALQTGEGCEGLGQSMGRVQADSINKRGDLYSDPPTSRSLYLFVALPSLPSYLCSVHLCPCYACRGKDHDLGEELGLWQEAPLSAFPAFPVLLQTQPKIAWTSVRALPYIGLVSTDKVAENAWHC